MVLHGHSAGRSDSLPMDINPDPAYTWNNNKIFNSLIAAAESSQIQSSARFSTVLLPPIFSFTIDSHAPESIRSRSVHPMPPTISATDASLLSAYKYICSTSKLVASFEIVVFETSTYMLRKTPFHLPTNNL